jgi:predicted dehydrogenase
MVTAAAEAGAHIYLEKPFAATAADADRMVEAVERAGVKLQLAHQTRLSPDVLLARQMVRQGEIGVIQEIRGRGKEDARAGGEDLMVLGSHVCDLMRMFAGDPKWVFAHVTLDGQEVTPALAGKPTEPIGPMAGNQIAAVFAFDKGIHGYLATKASDQTHPDRFGIYVFGSKGVVFIPIGFNANKHPAVLRSARWMEDGEHSWEPIQGKSPLDVSAEDRQRSNALMVHDLLQAVEEDRKPVCSEVDGRWIIEMISGVYLSQMKAASVGFPLADRRHPLQS